MKKTLALIPLALLIAFSATSVATSPESKGLTPSDNPPDIFKLVNDEREAKGLKPLKYAVELESSAKAKCKDMQTEKYWSHSRSDKEWSEFISVDYKRAGENLAKGFDTEAEAVKGWMNSPSHYENIVGDWDYVGYYECQGFFHNLIVQHFVKY